MHAGARYGNLTKDATASVVDGYPGFERLRANHIQLAACWAHARRKFYEVHQATGSPIAAEALRRIADLYAIETTIWGQTADKRQGVRRTQSLPLVEAMKVWLEAELNRIPPRSGLADGNPVCADPLERSWPLPR